MTPEQSTADPSQSREGVAPVKDRLVTTLFLAALFHGIVLLGVSFGVAISDSGEGQTLEVLLVNEQMPEALDNPNANYLAQRSQQGAGNTKDGRTSIPLSSPLTLDTPGTPDGEAFAQQDDGRASKRSSTIASRADEGPQFGDSAEADGARQKALLMSSGPSSPLPSADDGNQLVLMGEDEGARLLTPNARWSDVAVYLGGWRQKVERIGTLNYPRESRRRGDTGNPEIEVAILANGHLREAIVRRSSGSKALDQAALAILRMAAPFEPFPPDLKKKHAELRFTYGWEFGSGSGPARAKVKSR